MGNRVKKSGNSIPLQRIFCWWYFPLPNEINLFLYYRVFPEARDWVSRGWLLWYGVLFFKRGKILSAGRLNKKSLGIVMLLSVGLLLAGCSGSKSSDTGTYSGSVYTVKRGDTLYRISRTTGTSVKELARLNGISPLHHWSWSETKTGWGEK